MKWLLVLIVRGTQPGDPVMLRPPPWDSEEVQRWGHHGAVRDGGLARGQDVEEELVLISDTIANSYTAENPTHYRILTDFEADKWCERAAALRGEPAVAITDPDRIRLTETKMRAAALAAEGKLANLEVPPVTQEDLDALDPDRPTPGVNRIVRKASTYFPGVTSRPAPGAPPALGSDAFNAPTGT